MAVRRRRIIAASWVALIWLPGAALAADATASFNITVIIPPLGAAVAAVKSGAVGAWAMDSTNTGVMISTPDNLKVGQTGQVSLFLANSETSDVRIVRANSPGIPSSNAAIVSVQTTPFQGLQKTTYVVRATGSDAPTADATTTPVALVVGEI